MLREPERMSAALLLRLAQATVRWQRPPIGLRRGPLALESRPTAWIVVALIVLGVLLALAVRSRVRRR